MPQPQIFPKAKPRYLGPRDRHIVYKGYTISVTHEYEEDKEYDWIVVTTPEGKEIQNPRHTSTKKYFTVPEIKQYIDNKEIEKGENVDNNPAIAYFNDSANYFMSLFEAIDAQAVGPKRIKIQDAESGRTEEVDLSNFIYANTNGGTEPVALYGIRKNDSKSDPSKRAGSEMVITGRLNYKYSPTGGRAPMGNAQDRYNDYDILTLEVSSVDGKPYPPKSRRNIKVNSIHKIVMGRETYNILR